ncbi:MAG: hypothetical protein ACREKH_11315 [Candidatus Rokuibacteriota bacterium]
MVAGIKIADTRVPSWWIAVGAGVLGYLVYAFVRRRPGEGLFGSVGRGVGEGVTGAVTGAVGGVVSAVEGATSSTLDWLGVPPLPEGPGNEWSDPMMAGSSFDVESVGGGSPFAAPTNLVGLHGTLIWHGGGDYEFHVQNSGELDLSPIEITLRRDGPNLLPIVYKVALVPIPAGSGVRGRGQITPGGQVRLYADNYLIDKVG